MLHVPELSPTEFASQWPNWRDSDEVVLLDVREHDELAQAAVGQTVHIPMNEVPGRLDELDKSTTLVVMCHSGGRSRRVAQFLLSQGYRHVANLSGGIDAWSQQVDPGVPRY